MENTPFSITTSHFWWKCNAFRRVGPSQYWYDLDSLDSSSTRQSWYSNKSIAIKETSIMSEILNTHHSTTQLSPPLSSVVERKSHTTSPFCINENIAMKSTHSGIPGNISLVLRIDLHHILYKQPSIALFSTPKILLGNSSLFYLEIISWNNSQIRLAGLIFLK